MRPRDRLSLMALPAPAQARFTNQLEEFMVLQPNLVLQDFARRAGVMKGEAGVGAAADGLHLDPNDILQAA